jgi:hypothetical protein
MFLPPVSHVEDVVTKTTYAICEAEECGKWTCVHCKMLLSDKRTEHKCGSNEEDEKFKQMVIEKGYQACFVCGVTVELIEACNHIT